MADASLTLKKDGGIVLRGKAITIEDSAAITRKSSKAGAIKGGKLLQH